MKNQDKTTAAKISKIAREREIPGGKSEGGQGGVRQRASRRSAMKVWLGRNECLVGTQRKSGQCPGKVALGHNERLIAGQREPDCEAADAFFPRFARKEYVTQRLTGSYKNHSKSAFLRAVFELVDSARRMNAEIRLFSLQRNKEGRPLGQPSLDNQ